MAVTSEELHSIGFNYSEKEMFQYTYTLYMDDIRTTSLPKVKKPTQSMSYIAVIAT